MNMIMRHRYTIFFSALFFCIGVIFSVFLPSKISTPTITALRQSSLNAHTEYSFIDPIIGLKNPNTTVLPEYKNLEQNMQTFIAGQVSSGRLKTASVYFRDINGSGGVTINPDEQYSPASLSKVPTMIAYYKIAESNPDILKDKIYYDGAVDMNEQEHIKSPIHIVPRTVYTVAELIEYMIRYSDNNAATLLIDHLNKTGYEDVFNNLFRDMSITEVSLTDDYMTISAYALFFRILYNATYINREMSERALKLMSQTDFTKGIDAGVAHNTVVSQKFGEFTVLDSRGSVLKRELHNCGIVYYPHHPYLLCIMTKGNDFGALENVIAQISRMIYEYIETK